jgi:MoaA/NifB/PqqE/SkfB family radical SAM enzyme
MSAPRLHPQMPSEYRDARRNVEINVGKSCNYKCVFCLDGMPTKDDKRFIPFEEMQAELRRWRAEGHLSVGFLGGEPTTYPKIVESVAYAREVGFTRIALATNAIMMRRDAFLDRLIEAGLTRTTISMHGHTPELEDRLTGVPGGFHKKVAAIRNLKARRAQGHLRDGISVNIVLNGWNYRQLLPMMRFFFDEIGLEDLRVNFVRPEGYAEDNADLVPTYTEVVPYLIKAIVLNETHFRKVFTFGGFPMCVLPKSLLESEPLLRRTMGDVFWDLSTDCSIRKETDEDDGVSRYEGGRARFNWQDRKRFDLKHHIDACRRCELSSPCEGVWRGYLDIYGDDEFAPLSVAADQVVRTPRRRTPPTPAARSQPRRFARRLVVLPPSTL